MFWFKGRGFFPCAGSYRFCFRGSRRFNRRGDKSLLSVFLKPFGSEVAWPRLSGLRSEAATGRPLRARSKPSVQPHSLTPHGWHHDMRWGERKNSSFPSPEETPDSCRPLKEESGEKRGGERKQVKEGEKRSHHQRGSGRCGGFAPSSPPCPFEPSALYLEGIMSVALGLSSLSIRTHVWFPWQLFLSFSTLSCSYLSLRNLLWFPWMQFDRRLLGYLYSSPALRTTFSA